MNEQIARIDRDLDEVLVNLGHMVLRLSHPAITRTPQERAALARSVNQFSVCATRSNDERVQHLADELQETLKPRLVVSR